LILPDSQEKAPENQRMDAIFPNILYLFAS
jgi:hypothetical protein